jgi:hypothetical protein
MEMKREKRYPDLSGRHRIIQSEMNFMQLRHAASSIDREWGAC